MVIRKGAVGGMTWKEKNENKTNENRKRNEREIDSYK